MPELEERFVALALPFFAVLIAVEVFLCRRLKDEPRYRFADSMTDLSCGLGTQVLEPFLRTAGLAGYVLLYDHVRLATVPTTSVAGWVALVVLVDFFYYVFHRASHRINVFWALHVVHHQSEEFNLVVALRQSWFELLFSGVFYLPLAVAGFSPLAFVAVSTSNTLYQFWIHTRLVGKLPVWLESWLNTPSHHRVHHGVNPKYIDKNYAGMFIVWDRWLGTFQEEEEEPVYGTVKPLASFNPLWANVHYWAEMAALAKSAPRLADKLRVAFAPPEWRPRELSNGLGYVTIPEASRATQKKHHVPVSRGLVAYVSLQFATALVASTVATTLGTSVPLGVPVAALALILLEVIVWGALFEAKPWGTTLAILRLLATAAVIAWFSRGAAMGMTISIGTGVALAGMALWVVKLSRARQGGGPEAFATS